MSVPRIEAVPGAAGIPLLLPNEATRPMRRTLRHPRRKRARRGREPVLRFSPTAWAKLLFLRDQGETEVGGFGISADDDAFYVVDFRLVRQTCTLVSVSFDDEAVADFYDEQIDAGKPISHVGRIWIHTHPGDCPVPSGTDEATFDRVFGRPDWAVMFILARHGATYGRLRFNNGPGAELPVRTRVDFDRLFEASDFEIWAQEYAAAVLPESEPRDKRPTVAEPRWLADIPGYLDELEPGERIWG